MDVAAEAVLSLGDYGVLLGVHLSSYCYICVLLILLYMLSLGDYGVLLGVHLFLPRTAIYVSSSLQYMSTSYCYICVLLYMSPLVILLYMCPPHCSICVLGVPPRLLSADVC